MNQEHKYEVRRVAIADIKAAPTVGSLAAGYAGECGDSVALDGALSLNWEAYKALEAIGAAKAFGAFVGGALVGFAVVVVSPSLRRSGMEAAAETLYLNPAHRRGGPGLELLRAARDAALEAGAPGLIVTAPAGSRLERLAGAAGFDLVSRNYLVR